MGTIPYPPTQLIAIAWAFPFAETLIFIVAAWLVKRKSLLGAGICFLLQAFFATAALHTQAGELHRLLDQGTIIMLPTATLFITIPIALRAIKS